MRASGSLRPLPCNGPNLLGSVFPFLCDGEPPVALDVWEISRLCLSRSIRAAERRSVGNQLATELAPYALQNGITACCCVADRRWYSQLLSFGWRCEPLGLPRDLECGIIAALKILITDETPTLMDQAGFWSGSLAPLDELAH